MQICCELCGIKLMEGEKCVFATVNRTIEGKEYIFCCAKHADRYEAGLKTGEAAKKSIKKPGKKLKSGKSKSKKSKKGGRK